MSTLSENGRSVYYMTELPAQRDMTPLERNTLLRALITQNYPEGMIGLVDALHQGKCSWLEIEPVEDEGSMSQLHERIPHPDAWNVRSITDNQVIAQIGIGPLVSNEKRQIRPIQLDMASVTRIKKDAHDDELRRNSHKIIPFHHEKPELVPVSLFDSKEMVEELVSTK